MLSKISSSLHRMRRRLSRSEWAVRHLGLPVSSGTSEEPGLLLIQIDGLARAELEKAMEAGHMPFLNQLRSQSGYDLNNFYPGLPSTTPAVQAELYYGVKTGVPAFSFQNRASGEVGSMFDPDWVQEFEKQFESQGEGLLKGGSSWSNIYSGGATEENCHFCISSLWRGGLIRKDRIGTRFIFTMMHLPELLRIGLLILLELALGIGDALWGLFGKGQRLDMELAAMCSRMCVGIGMRELLRVGGKLDVTRGLPIVHLNFVGYDELSHRRGPGSAFAHWSLRGIDGAIRDLYREAHRSHRRDYQVWIFSDHGQDRTRSFETEFPGGIKRVVRDCLPVEETEFRQVRETRQVRPYSRILYEREKLRRAKLGGEAGKFSVAAMGPVGHLYFQDPLDDGEKLALAKCLVVRGKIPAVLLLHADRTVTWVDAQGEVTLPEDVCGRITCYPERLRKEMAADLVRLCQNENAGDLVLLGYCGSGGLLDIHLRTRLALRTWTAGESWIPSDSPSDTFA